MLQVNMSAVSEGSENKFVCAGNIVALDSSFPLLSEASAIGRRNGLNFCKYSFDDLDTLHCQSGYQPEKLLISSDFKRSKHDLEQIQAKKISSRQEKKNIRYREFRSASKERSQKRRYGKVLSAEYEDLAISFEEHHETRTHEKRVERKQLRKEHQELLKWRKRHQMYLDNQRAQRKMLQYAELHVEAFSTRSHFSNMRKGLLYNHPKIADGGESTYVEVKSDEEKSIPPPNYNFPKEEESGFANLKKKLNKLTRETYNTIVESLTPSEDIIEKISSYPAFAYLKQCMSGNKDGSYNYWHTLFGNLVSSLCFLRISCVMPWNATNVSALCWLYLKSIGFTNDVSLIGSASFGLFTGLLRTFIRLFQDHHEKNGVEMSVESYSESLDSFLAGTTNFLSHPLITSARNILIFLAALHIFEKPVAGNIFRHLGKPEGFSIIALLTTVLSDISSMIKMGESWLFGKPGSINLFGENPLQSSHAKLLSHMEMADYVYTGLPVAGYIERNDYINTLKELIDTVTAASTTALKAEVKRLKIPLVLIEAKKLLMDFTGAAIASFRPTPFGVVVHGVPGVGKSHVLKFLCYIHSMVKGRKFSENHIFTRTTDYWEGYSPFSHPYVHYSEAGKMKKGQALAKGDVQTDELLSVIDNLSYPVNMAFKDKGKIFCLPEMVILDTNNPSLNFDELYENPAAFRRRFLFVEVQVKPQFTADGISTSAFDKTKPGASTAGTDAWLFHIYTLTPVDNTTSTKNTLLDLGTAEMAIPILVRLFSTHIRYEEKILKQLSNNSMFSRHEEQIMRCATVHGCFVEQKIEMKEDLTFDIHPESVYAQVQLGSKKLKTEVSEAMTNLRKKAEEEVNKLVTPISAFFEKPPEKVHFPRIDEDYTVETLAELFGDPEESDAEDIQTIVLTDDEVETIALIPKVRDDGPTNLQSSRKEVSQVSQGKIVVEVDKTVMSVFDEIKGLDRVKVVQRDDDKEGITELMNLPLKQFLKVAPMKIALQDLVAFFLDHFDAQRINEFAHMKGMFASWRIDVEYKRGKRVLFLREPKFLGRGEMSTVGEIYFTSDYIQVTNSPIWNVMLRMVSAWEYFYEAWQYCAVASTEPPKFELKSEAGEMYMFLGMMQLPCLLWAMSLFFITKLVNSRTVIMSTGISCDRLFYFVFSMVCIYFRAWGPWVFFMSVLLSFASVEDNLRHQGTAILNKCFYGCLDGILHTTNQVQSYASGTVDNTPRKGFVKYKAVLTFAGVAIAGLATVTATASLMTSAATALTKKKTTVIAAPAQNHEQHQNVNIVLASTPPKPIVDYVEPALASETTFSKPSDYDADLLEKETRYHCGKSIERIPNKLDLAKWNVMVRPPPKYTGKPEQFVGMIGYNCRVAVAVCQGNQRTTHIYGLCANFAIVHRHAFKGPVEGSMLMVSATGFSATEEVARATRLSHDSYVILGNDLVLVQVNETRFKDIMSFLPSEKFLPDISYGFVGKDEISLQRRTQTIYVNDGKSKVELTDFYQYSWANHDKGNCGMPVVAATGKGFVLVAVHSAGCDRTNICGASVLNKAKIESGMSMLTKATALCPLASASMECLDTESPIGKSVVRFVPMHGAIYHGKLPGNVIMPSPSKVVQTGLNEDNAVDRLFEENLHHVCSTFFGPPPMKGFWRDGDYFDPVVRFATKIGQQKQALDRTLLSRCVNEYADKIVAGFAKLSRFSIQPWDLDTAINGAIHDAYARSMDLNKASGFGRKGAKKAYFDVATTATGKWAEMIDSLRKDVLEALNAYESGDSPLVFFEACLKDEPRDLKKCAIGKTRTFCVSPLVNLIITRMFFGPVFSTMVEDGEIFCVAIGIDMHRCAEDLYLRLESHSKLVMELDYGNYDQTMPYELGWASGSVVYQVCKRLGYNDYALKIVSGLVSDNLHPFVVMKQDVFELPGYQPSGKYGTAEDNSLRGVLMLMYAWYHPDFNQHLGDKKFFDYVLPYVYGDDVVAGVKEEVSEIFNNITYSNFCEYYIGLECTPATKDAKFEKFVTLNTMMFLKRRFQKHPTFDKIVAPLDLDSLMKTLMWHIPSNSISKAEQVIAATDSVVRELFFHCDEDVFKKMTSQLYDLVETKFKINPGSIKRLRYMELASATLCTSDSRSVEVGRQNNLISDHAIVEEEMKSFDHKLAQEVAPALKIESTNLKNSCVSSSEHKSYQGTQERLSQLATCEDELLKLQIKVIAGKAETEDFTRIQELRSTIKFLSTPVFEVESEEGIGSSNATEEKHENLRDVAGSYTDKDIPERTFSNFALSQTDVDLRKFLSRPVLVSNGTMALSNPVSLDFSIYSILLSKPNIRAKLRNFAYFKADICVKLVISGTNFHQGRAIMAWIPWYNNCPSAVMAMTHGDPLLQAQYLSTTAYQKTLDIKANQPAELRIPYMSPQPIGRLFNNSNLVLPASGSFDDFVDMGSLFIRSIGVFEAVSATATNPYYQLYAWFENITYTMTTGTKIELAVESDERVKGPVERVSSSIASTMKKLSSSALLAPFTVPSSIAAKGVSDIAAIMGWSRPSLITDTQRMRNEPYTCAANTIGADLCHRITFDPKQELTVDPSVLGVSHDELDIAGLCAREQLLDRANWTTSVTPMTPFWRMAVQPCAQRKSTLVSASVPSPMALAASFFGYWHGDITLRFDIVKSTFHKGKFAVIWEPNGPQQSLIGSSLALNTDYVYIVDVQEMDQLEVTVKWSFPSAWASIPTPSNSVLSVGTIGAVSPNFLNRSCNGVIYLVPITSLQAPLDRTVHINVYIKSENMHFNVLRSPRNLPYSATVNPGFQKGTIDEKGDFTLDVESAEVGGEKPVSVVINTAANSYDGISTYHFGEEPMSIRASLKRFRTFASFAGSGTPFVTCASSIIPPLDPPVGSSTLSYLDDGNLGIWRRCFIGIRGGMKYRVRRVSTASTASVLPGDSAVITLREPEGVNSAFNVAPNSDFSQFDMTSVGSSVFVPFTQPGVEFEVPFYSTSLFHFSQLDDPLPIKNYMDPNQVRNWSFSQYAPSTAASRIFVDVAIGEDFMLMHFVSSPMMSV